MKSFSLIKSAACLAALTSSAISQFIPAPEDLTYKEGYAGVGVRYKEVPTGVCETVEGVKSYTGYADVGHNQHLFFWFFEKRTNPKDADLTVWINGGPGSSSMIGLWQELGPCGYFNNSVTFNPYSWNNVSNMLFM
jgi:carboxypeptidase C (cathepsin A)